jgi:glycine/D-amino acid oxidase-like deaminating enzyme/nitrite reductase/ring-hydroxylating ferredoxin subunit
MKTSYWQSRLSFPSFPALDRDLNCDVLVVGGGIAGVTAAYLLQREGIDTVLVERDICAGGDTRHTTAHLTYVTDERLSTLANDFGKNNAQAAWDAGRAAIEKIHELTHEARIDCDFRRAPGYLHSPWDGDDQTESLKKDCELANEFGFDAEFVQSVPNLERTGIRFPDQAKFHPLKFVRGLLKKLKSDTVFERSDASEVEGDPHRVKVNGRTVECRYLVLTTHVPLQGKSGLLNATLFQTKLYPYSSYVIGAKAPKGTVPEALFWDTMEPYYYLRVDSRNGHDYLIFGGLDHKTGQGPEGHPFSKLKEVLLRKFPKARVDYEWSGQVVETVDGLPYIGETAPSQFAGTGFAGNGMTFGVLTAMMAADAAQGRVNPWARLFDPARKKPVAGAWDYIKENADYPYYLIRDRLRGAEGKSLDDLQPGEGKLLRLDSRRVAAFKDDAGCVSCVSPVCTHMGCYVRWNRLEKTWDCPCHGSRFHPSGEVIGGPAETPLEKIEVKSAT